MTNNTFLANKNQNVSLLIYKENFRNYLQILLKEVFINNSILSFKLYRNKISDRKYIEKIRLLKFEIGLNMYRELYNLPTLIK